MQPDVFDSENKKTWDGVGGKPQVALRAEHWPRKLLTVRCSWLMFYVSQSLNAEMWGICVWGQGWGVE